MGMTTDELNFKPRLQVINEEQIEQIHCALWILLNEPE